MRLPQGEPASSERASNLFTDVFAGGNPPLHAALGAAWFDLCSCGIVRQIGRAHGAIHEPVIDPDRAPAQVRWRADREACGFGEGRGPGSRRHPDLHGPHATAEPARLANRELPEESHQPALGIRKAAVSLPGAPRGNRGPSPWFRTAVWRARAAVRGRPTVPRGGRQRDRNPRLRQPDAGVPPEGHAARLGAGVHQPQPSAA